MYKGFFLFLQKRIIHSNNNNHINGFTHRLTHSPFGYYARSGIRLSDEGRNAASSAKNIARFCIGCNGGGIGMVVADSINGNGSGQRMLVGIARCRRIPVGYGLLADD